MRAKRRLFVSGHLTTAKRSDSMSDVVHLDELKVSVGDGKSGQNQVSVEPEEARQADVTAVPTPSKSLEKENKWKLAFRQLMFMKRMNMQFNDRTKNEIELRQQNISPTSLICSVPYFNGFSAEDIKALVAASRRENLRPGETLLLNLGNADAKQEGRFYIVNSGNLALAKATVPRAVALRQAELYPQLRLGIGDYFCVHAASEMKVIAMELTEYLVIPMKKILDLNSASCALIDTEKHDLTPEDSEMESFKKWALQFSLIRQKSEYPTAEPGGFANCSVKTFCKDHFPNITPENELDHTLEYMKSALTSIFSARKVRIYALDKPSGQLVVKLGGTELFPSPPEGPVSQDHRQLMLSIGKLSLSIPETATFAKISIQHGSTTLYQTSTVVRYEPRRDSNGDKSAARMLTCDPSAGIEMGLRLIDIPHARFLLLRALTNPAQIGYLLYWFLKAESHNYQTAERFELITSQYLQLCGSYKLEIRQSVYVMRKLEEIAGVVKGESSGAARKEKLHEALRAVVLPETFQLPLQPRSYCTSIIVENCRVMESKKRPLFLQLESAKAQHGRPYVIFKAGDDLRQDQLVLQILRVMDDLWREAELDLCLLPYACISTGDEIGMIEVVGDSETLASIIYARHAKSSTRIGRKLKAAADALIKDGVISDWLFKSPGSPIKTRAISDGLALDAVSPNLPATDSAPSSPTKEVPSVSSCFPLSPRRLMGRKKSAASRDQEITQNFVRSCAGYCVATYVLGIGDRHNDNIMLQRSGKFFHIDFGHFLGHFKSKLGVKRERAPFVFTPSMLDTMGGKKSENYQQFQTLACDAFQVLRTNSNLLITLLVLALTCGIPELTSVNNIKWVHKTLMLDLPDDEARDAFKKLINVALNTTTTKLNDAAHLMAH
ncbi:hypothetical protein BBI17_007544 [Phytophthora kernoviae]|uniref:phosphatidylinositol 3-kinase n=1 Tax=Phytophthora kernoviae TaxID=325452 RepID=A0A421EU13_9STRA|nr:hypothetical protein BBI17_007544 [Phytophthora kernoviae]